MTIRKRIFKSSIAASLVILANVTGCGSQPEKTQTLADVDVSTKNIKEKKEKPLAEETRKRSSDAVKNAYYEFLEGSEKADEHRAQAVRRIAEIELSSATQTDEVDEAQYTQTVQRTIQLLKQSLRDFPEAPGNDQTLYQLAKAYDQLGEAEKAVETLEQLVFEYPHTKYFVEAKFRIAENAFINGFYFKSEDAYTDVMKNAENPSFVEKAFFKRGWARYKQDMYKEALSDFYQALDIHDFGAYEQLSNAEKEVNDEYYRAIGLSFIYLGGPEALNDYFLEHPGSQQIYRTYLTVTNLLLKQERVSDAIDTLKAYQSSHPKDPYLVDAALLTFQTWKDNNFFSRYVSEFENFYTRFNPDAEYWQVASLPNKEAKQKLAYEAMRENIVQLAAYNHSQYRKNKKLDQKNTAQKWYERYLAGFKQFARQDKIYQLYAELLNQNREYEAAYKYYELAAFDGDIVLDKESAYQVVYLSDLMFKRASEPVKSQWLAKHLDYSYAYAELYAKEPRTSDMILYSVQTAFKNNLLEQAINFANILPDTAPLLVRKEVNLLRAQSYFDLGDYEEAEIMYQDLLVDRNLSKREKVQIEDKLALSYYRQAEKAKSEGSVELAAMNFLKVYSDTPQSELAPTAVYDAIALFMSNKMWNEAIEYLNVFKNTYPQHPYQQDVTKKLSVAYLNANRGLDAAKEFEKLSGFVESEEEKMAALWQAAELYYKKDDSENALRAYKQYAHTYKRPYPQNMEAMNILSDIYAKQNDLYKRSFWLKKMVSSDQRAAASNKSERTQYLAANAAFQLALLRLEDYHKVRLTLPLAQSLKAKKSAMQDSVKLFGQASQYGHKEFVTEGAHQIGGIYQSFAKALLESERPKKLTEDQLEQYNILLEDQAFPFEDKAIEFYEANISRIAQGTYNEWISRSLESLAKLFPARYGREPKLETYIERL